VSKSKLRQILAPSLLGLKRNLLPGLVLQACALLIVLGYVYVPSVHTLFDEIGQIKTRYGYGFSALSTAFFGGVIPFIVLFFMGGIAKGKGYYELLFFAGFWCWKGVEVDAFYRLQAVIFGNENDVATIAMKTAVDQLIYNSLWACPTQVVFFLWKDGGFSWSQFKENLKLIPLRRRVLALLFSGWMVWIPTVMIVYSLPVALQIPLFNVVLCFWCLLVSFVVKTTS
jgi:hypothetical protein